MTDQPQTSEEDDDWRPAPRRMPNDEEAHLFVHLVASVCERHGYGGELSVADWLEERLSA